MYDTRQDLLDAFRASPQALEGVLRNCTPEQAHNARGGDENWSVVEVVCHLRDAEERALERMRAMRDQTDPFLPGYDQAVWAKERKYAEADLNKVFADYKRLRAVHLAELEALPPAGWAREGRHEEQGQITIENHTWHLVSHDLIHAAQIARQLV